jgi:HK97 gp10 family phage protein
MAQLKWDGDRVSARIKAKLATKAHEAAQILVAEAKAEAPVDSGELRDSIREEPSSNPEKTKVVVDAPHAFWVEFGTRDRPADPFFRRAIYGAMTKMGSAFRS